MLLGLGMGGEWASGAALVSETWPAEHRGKALGLDAERLGDRLRGGRVVNDLVQPAFGWRAVFFVGILPAFLTLWIRRRVQEPRICGRLARPRRHARVRHAPPFSDGLGPLTVALTFMNACTLFAWWGFYLWLPELPLQPVAQGGVGLQLLVELRLHHRDAGRHVVRLRDLRIRQRRVRPQADLRRLPGDGFARCWPRFCRRGIRRSLLALGPFVAFFATGYFSGFGAVTAEIYPTAIRATAQGFTYNIGRLVSAVAPFTVGSLAQTHGFGLALSMSSAAFLLAALTWVAIPETRGVRRVTCKVQRSACRTHERWRA